MYAATACLSRSCGLRTPTFFSHRALGAVLAQGIHTTAIARKSRKARDLLDSSDDDLFSSNSQPLDDLFGGSASTRPDDRTPSSSEPAPVGQTEEFKNADPAILFEEQYTFLAKALDPKQHTNHSKTPVQLKENAFNKLVMYVRTKEHMEKAVEILQLWRESGRTLDRSHTRALIDRCLKRHPGLLVQIFSHRAKYGVDIPKIVDARRILYHLVASRNLAITHDPAQRRAADVEAFVNAATFAALYPSYGLRQATRDLTSCTLLTQACAKVVVAEQSEDNGTIDTAVLEQAKRGMLSLSHDLDQCLKGLPAQQLSFTSFPLATGEQREVARKKLGRRLTSSARAWGKTPSRVTEWSWVQLGLSDIKRSILRWGAKDGTISKKHPLIKTIEDIAFGNPSRLTASL